MRQHWFSAPGYGLFMHYLADNDTTLDEWNRRTDAFDVELVADQAATAGAKWMYLTAGQNSGFYCSPNMTYDSILAERGFKPRCSERDLISDFADALLKRGIYPMVYSTSMGPFFDDEAIQALEAVPPWNCNKHVGNYEHVKKYAVSDPLLKKFQTYWEAMHREWSLRWGKKVNGWWIDGSYYSDKMYRHADAPNFESFASAIRAGNPESMIAFNPGIVTPPHTLSSLEDYTAGEANEPWAMLDSDFNVPDGAVKHILTYTGVTWNAGEQRFCQNELSALIQTAEHRGVALTLDVPFSSENGAINPRAIDAFRAIPQLKKQNPLPLLKAEIIPPVWSNRHGGKSGKLILRAENTTSSEMKISPQEGCEPFAATLVPGEKKKLEITIRKPENREDIKRCSVSLLCNGLIRKFSFDSKVCYESSSETIPLTVNDGKAIGRLTIARTPTHLNLDALIFDPLPEVNEVTPWLKSCMEIFLAPARSELDRRAHIIILPETRSSDIKILKMDDSGGLVPVGGIIECAEFHKMPDGYRLQIGIPWEDKICRMDIATTVKHGEGFSCGILFLGHIADAEHLPEITL